MTESSEPTREPLARPRRVVAISVALMTSAVLTAGAVTVLMRSPGAESAASSDGAEANVRTTVVRRTDLSDRQTLPGTLGFGSERPLKARGTGTVTRLPTAGSTVARGKALYWVNDQPVMVFYGDTPLFRKLDKPGLRGRDVTVLAENLSALGYRTGVRTSQSPADPSHGVKSPRTAQTLSESGTVFTPTLRSALESWQRDTGQQPTGTLGIGQVVVLPAPSRVASVTAQLGDEASGELLSLTSLSKAVTVPMDATDVGAIKNGASVTIQLPNSRQIRGRVTSISHDVQGGATNDSPESSGPPRVDVVITPTRSNDIAMFDSASVQVTFTTETRSKVLAVPIEALLALREGGYALQLENGTLVGVTTGLFTKGQVQISGSGVTAGLRVVTAS